MTTDANSRTITLRIDGMTCLDCAKTLERELGRLPDVRRVEVSYGAKRGHVTVADAADIDALAPALLRVVESNGYHATLADRRGSAEPAPPRGAESPSREVSGGRQEQEAGDRSNGAEYDLLVVGTGAAGMAAAIRASELSATAAIVEGAEVVGGTCVNIGCIPSKNLIEAAHQYHAARIGFPGIAPCEPALAWEQVLRQKRELVAALRQEKYVDVLDAYDGVTLLRGRAELLGHGLVRVGEREVRARKIVIATGTRPALPPIPGIEEAGALDSTSVMELERLPESLIVLGGGSIGLELGQAFSRFGVRVVVIEAAARILPTETVGVSEVLTQALTAEGVEIHTGVRATRIERTATGVRVHVEEGSVHGTVDAERLLVATGRRPNSEELGLGRADVRVNARGYVEVDAYMRTSNPDIFAAGDVTGGPGYVYVAALQGGIAAQAALADRTPEGAIEIDLSTVPRVTFTNPQVAAVGLSEAEARSAGLTPQVTTLPARHLPRAMVSHRTAGAITLVSEAGTDRLLGAHLVMPNAGDVIGEAVLAIRFGLTARDLVSTLHPYLTWGEGLKLAAQTFTKDVAKLSCCA